MNNEFGSHELHFYKKMQSVKSNQTKTENLNSSVNYSN